MSDAVERLRTCISASMINRVQKTSAIQLRDDIQDVLTQLAEAQASVAAAQKELANRIHTELDSSERARQSAAQLERSPCRHLVAEWVPESQSEIIKTDVGTSSERWFGGDAYCAACLREADAVRRGVAQAAQHVPWDYGMCSCGVKWTNGNSTHPSHDWTNHILASVAPASQPTTETLLNISDRNNEWNKRAIAANLAERGKDGE